MKVLICEIFVSLTAKTIEKYFKKLGWETVFKSYYTPEDLIGDRRIDNMIIKDLKVLRPDLVFSINFWPPVSRACHRERIRYISFSYDTPQEVPRDMVFDTNYIFLFDKIETQEYLDKGYERIYHAPLCTDVELWDSIKATSYKYDVSLIGSVYKSLYYTIMSGVDEYNRGFFKALIDAQQKIYGYYLLGDVVGDQVDSVNHCLHQVRPDFTISAAQMSWACASYVNYLDRISLLRLMQRVGQSHLFTDKLEDDDRELLKGTVIHPKVDYSTEMPVIFKETKINLNPTSRAIRSGTPQRVLDVLGCGAFVLSSYQPETADYFMADEEIVMYESYEDAVEKADFYLRNDTLREKIAKNGYEKVKSLFTYDVRLTQMLEIAGF